MSSDARKDQPHLTPEQRREMLRAFADRMLVKITQMDDPEDMPGVERAVRVAAVIERLYNRCDRAEQQTPDPQQVRVERAKHEKDALYAQASLAEHLKWSQKRRRQLGIWWDAADEAVKTPVTGADAATASAPKPPRPADPVCIQTGDDNAPPATTVCDPIPAVAGDIPSPPP